MPRPISKHEMERRALIAQMKLKLNEAMEVDTLTFLEWIHVLQELQNGLLAEMLRDEWREENDERRPAGPAS